MDHLLGRQFITFGDLCIAGFAPVQHSTLNGQLRPGLTMDCTINPTSTEQGTVGCVYDCIKLKRGNVTDYYFERCPSNDVALKL